MENKQEIAEGVVLATIVFTLCALIVFLVPPLFYIYGRWVGFWNDTPPVVNVARPEHQSVSPSPEPTPAQKFTIDCQRKADAKWGPENYSLLVNYPNKTCQGHSETEDL